MPNLSIEIRFDELRSLAFGSISGTYAAVGTRLNNPTRMLIVQNETDAPLIVSFDGVVDHIYLGVGTNMIFDGTTNRVENNTGFFFSTNTQIYVKQASGAPSSGAFYASAIHGKGD